MNTFLESENNMYSDISPTSSDTSLTRAISIDPQQNEPFEHKIILLESPDTTYNIYKKTSIWQYILNKIIHRKT